MSEEELDDSHSINRTDPGDLEWKPNSLNEAEAPLQALGGCTPTSGKGRWLDNNNVWCSCGPDLPAEKSTEWMSSKSGLWDSCERNSSAPRRIRRVVTTPEGHREYRSYKSQNETPLHALLHKTRPYGPSFLLRRRLRQKAAMVAGKPVVSLVTAFQSFNISDLSHDKAEGDRYNANMNFMAHE
ncbi:hypothetical protein ONE63_003194 [Megalurothrips usitatus]|uniref:Uncharacterized protein n=1 Tax=Megalurothrips usitatus TaxID=439358 RepID=A0AAV7X6K3_9NEOP|nr:hypothetical protein ONE63_003194 [Megalurothrips usitatus]